MFKKENWSVLRLIILVFAIFCVYISFGRREEFIGNSKETAVRWYTNGKSTVEGDADTVIRQVFYPQNSLLENIYLTIREHGETGKMVITVFDEKGKSVAQTEVLSSQMKTTGRTEIPINVKVKKGAQYSYTVTFADVTDRYPVLTIASSTASSSDIIGMMAVNGESQSQQLYGQFTYKKNFTENRVWKLSVIAAIAMVLLGLFYPYIPVWETRLLPVFLLAHAALGVLILELAAGTNIESFMKGVDLAKLFVNTEITWTGTQAMLLNFLLACLIFIALSLVLWNGRLLLFVGTLICLVLGIAEYYVLEFRGTPLVPYDLGSISTAGEVSGGYTFDITIAMIVAFILFAAAMLLETKVRFKKYSIRSRIALYTGMLVFGSGSIVFLHNQPLIESKNNGRFFWNMNKSYKQYGYLLGTYLYERYQSVDKPEDYSTETVQSLTEYWSEEAAKNLESASSLTETEPEKSVYQDTGNDTAASADQNTGNDAAVSADQNTGDDSVESASLVKNESVKTGVASDNSETPEDTQETEKKLPNIIAIMNESLTDFSSVGGIETTQEILPFISSLTENTVRGNLYVSMFGGGTANSEFEFLTGSTMQYLPLGSTPYQAYIHDELPSLASYLKQYDYSTLAVHFANRTNWNRDTVYPLLGFDDFISSESLPRLEHIHSFVSDAAGYEQVEKKYEEWKESGESENFFCFNITIQNHGGYLKGYHSEGAPEYVGGDADVNEYLSCIWEADKAFQDLIEYFEAEEEPTIILMFGDHWPKLNDEFIESVLNQTQDISDLERNQNKYVTPFLIWANYDIEEKQYERLSANYLSTLLLETAEIPLNGYQTFLSEMMEELPVVNSIGIVDKDGNYYDSTEELNEEQAQWITDSQILQYSHLFGSAEEESFFADRPDAAEELASEGESESEAESEAR